MPDAAYSVGKAQKQHQNTIGSIRIGSPQTPGLPQAQQQPAIGLTADQARFVGWDAPLTAFSSISGMKLA
ncbi:hypothetical protein [Ferrovibrio sp.]|uniref:hypothetical protein n=1 Tax=Ferrovibrio sp. TaxID=1917215 RepID=UPI0035B22A5B